ncbi:hypothetical protein M378DRAFT_157961 [Amanita muscaria Koide BX008]|uniref:Uncharacterized protein n=1 Tax=Amanita muscaria (strain Koide BX008) TaxID=946122 RepID=A0A0C2XIM0_AMAMK|nr:hypothetical protein M378DRAFT_157961 [Amanita muscaria Koide BX008]
MSHNGGPSRAGDYPRITFHAQDRTFDRLLKESSLSELKKTVRTKLGLKSGSAIQLAQLRDWKSIDLEDEDDFDAFHSVAHEQRLVAVKVTLADNLSAEVPALEERPRKKHKRKHEAQTPPEQEAEPHVENYVSSGKKRKVAFTEPSAEIDEPTSSLEEPQTKRKKDGSSSIAAVAEPDRGSSHDSVDALKTKKQSSSHDSAEEPKKSKKRKRKSTVDFEADEVQSSTPSKHHPPPPGSETSHTESKALLGADSDQLPSVPEHSTLNEQEGPVAVEVSATRSKKKGAVPTESPTLEESPGVSVSSTTKTSKKKASRRKPDHANEAKPTHPPVGSIDDAESDVPLASSGGPDGAQKGSSG